MNSGLPDTSSDKRACVYVWGGGSVIDTLIFEKLDQNQHIHFIPLHEEHQISAV